jgi:hypothetical protein
MLHFFCHGIFVHGNLIVVNIFLSLAGDVRIGEPFNNRMVLPTCLEDYRCVDGKTGLERADRKALGPILFRLMEKGYDEDDSALTLTGAFRALV